MSSTYNYVFATEPTRNPLRYLLAVSRLLRDPTNTAEVAIVEIGFARSHIGRKFARWEEVLDVLRADPRTAPRLLARRPCEPIDLQRLSMKSEATLGRAFADHCLAWNLNPNLVHIAPETELDFMLHHLFMTHDIWHVVTGWRNDEVGEYALGGFYLAQLGGAFFGYLLGLAALSTAFRRRSFREFMDAVVAGYQMGKRAEPLFGIDWSAHWDVPLADLRIRFDVAEGRDVEAESRVAA